jgi:hypothetical protein
VTGVNTATWLSLIGMLVGIAVVWGSLKNEVGNLKTSLTELRAEFNRSRERWGERIEKLERAEEVARRVRRATKGIPAAAEGGETK